MEDHFKTRKESLWDIATKKNSETHKCSIERTLILIGSKLSGKSTIIQRFLDQNEPVKKTLAMEYNFGRKSGHSLTKDICHIWELGGGAVFINLLNVYLGKSKNTTLVLVLDLSSPETLWNILEKFLLTAFNILKKCEITSNSTAYGYKTDENHEDAEYITPFPVPLLIIGGKYDIFEHFEPEKRKIICRTLRQVAHSVAASVFFYSDKDPNLVRKLKEILYYHGFGASQWKGCYTDYNKPLLIPFGADSFEQLDVNVKLLPKSPTGIIIERFKHTYTTIFPQDSDSDALHIPDDPAKNPSFREPVIDLLRSQKDEELERQIEKDQRKKNNENFNV